MKLSHNDLRGEHRRDQHHGMKTHMAASVTRLADQVGLNLFQLCCAKRLVGEVWCIILYIPKSSMHVLFERLKKTARPMRVWQSEPQGTMRLRTRLPFRHCERRLLLLVQDLAPGYKLFGTIELATYKHNCANP